MFLVRYFLGNIMDIVGLLVGLASGAAGGNVAGKVMNSGMGTMGRSLTGIIGGNSVIANRTNDSRIGWPVWRPNLRRCEYLWNYRKPNIRRHRRRLTDGHYGQGHEQITVRFSNKIFVNGASCLERRFFLP